MPGVLFLDFDGPIFPSKVFLYEENNQIHSKTKCDELNLHPYVTYWKADPNAIIFLNKLYDTFPYDLVISSSWADDWLHQKEDIKNLLDANQLNYSLHKDWRTPRDNFNYRHEQIAEWLNQNPKYKENYIVLDDRKSGDGLSEEDILDKFNLNPNNIYLVDENEGITYKDYKKILSTIINW